MDTEIIGALRILIIDDSITMRQLIRHCLVSLGVSEVLQAENGEQGLEILNSDQNIHVIFCDIHMDKMDGLEFCQRVRRTDDLRKRSLPIIIMTGEQDKLMLDVVGDLGIVGILQKPFNISQVNDVLAKGIGLVI